MLKVTEPQGCFEQSLVLIPFSLYTRSSLKYILNDAGDSRDPEDTFRLVGAGQTI
jgi:hypothetical protein